MSTENIIFGKKVFTTVDGTVASCSEAKLYKNALALAKAQAKVSDNEENALRVALYLKDKSDDESLWAYIGAHPVITLRKTSVSDPFENDNPAEFISIESERPSTVLPVWFESIAKEYRTMRAKIAKYFELATYIADNSEETSAPVGRSACYETMYQLAKLMGITFNKAAFRAFETSANRLRLDKDGVAEVKTVDIDKLIMAAFQLTNSAMDNHDLQLQKKLSK